MPVASELRPIPIADATPGVTPIVTSAQKQSRLRIAHSSFDSRLYAAAAHAVPGRELPAVVPSLQSRVLPEGARTP